MNDRLREFAAIAMILFLYGCIAVLFGSALLIDRPSHKTACPPHYWPLCAR